MTLLGWTLMILFWGAILTLNVYCFIKVFSKKDLK